MYEIVANKKNSLDVDKLDYLQRDSMHLGLTDASFEQTRIITGARVINNHICYNQKIYNDIEQVFMTRYRLFKECYSHRVCRAIDYMVVDALLEANPVYRFEDTLNDPSRYVHVTDNVLQHIENSKSVELLAARNILKRIKQRNLYRILAQTLITEKDEI